MFSKYMTKISTYLFLDIIKLIEARFKTLQRVLEFGQIHEDVRSYLCNISFITFIVGIFLEFILILLMVKMNIYFTIFSFTISIFFSATLAGLIFFVLFRYPFYVAKIKRKEIEDELEVSIKHLSVLEHKNMSVLDVIKLLQNLENNRILTLEAKKILSFADLNQNLRGTLKSICESTYSELEYDFFNKIIDVLDKKVELHLVFREFIEGIDQNRKQKLENKKSKINLLFSVNMFLFFLVIILLFGIFFTPLYETSIRKILMTISIMFPIIEIILVFILNK